MTMETVMLSLFAFMSLACAACSIWFAYMARQDATATLEALGKRWEEDVTRRDTLLSEEKARLLAEVSLYRNAHLESTRLLALVKAAGGKVKGGAAPQVSVPPQKAQPNGVPMRGAREALVFPSDPE